MLMLAVITTSVYDSNNEIGTVVFSPELVSNKVTCFLYLNFKIKGKIYLFLYLFISAFKFKVY